MGLFLAAGAAGFATLLLVLAAGRRVESAVGRFLILLLSLALATAVSLGILALAGKSPWGQSRDCPRRDSPGTVPERLEA